MEEIETIPELIEWLDEQLSQITEDDGRRPYFGYCNVINEAHEHVLFLCKEHLQLIPKRQAFGCASEERTAALMKNAIEELQTLRNAVDHQKHVGGAPSRNEAVWKFIKKCDEEKPKPSSPDIAKRLNKKYAGHRTFTGASVRGIRFDYNGGRERSKQNHKKRRRKTRRKTPCSS